MPSALCALVSSPELRLSIPFLITMCWLSSAPILQILLESWWGHTFPFHLFGPVGSAVLLTPVCGCSQAVDSLYSAFSHLLTSKSRREGVPPKRGALCVSPKTSITIVSETCLPFPCLRSFFHPWCPASLASGEEYCSSRVRREQESFSPFLLPSSQDFPHLWKRSFKVNFRSGTTEGSLSPWVFFRGSAGEVREGAISRTIRPF